MTRSARGIFRPRENPLIRNSQFLEWYFWEAYQTFWVQKRSNDYLTIIPRARMGYESIAHEAEGRMGYWLVAHEGEWNNCFSKIKLVRQK